MRVSNTSKQSHRSNKKNGFHQPINAQIIEILTNVKPEASASMLAKIIGKYPSSISYSVKALAEKGKIEHFINKPCGETGIQVQWYRITQN